MTQRLELERLRFRQKKSFHLRLMNLGPTKEGFPGWEARDEGVGGILTASGGL